MDTRCDHCGYVNSLDYRFCGMCGVPLPVPVAVEPAQKNRTVSRPVTPREAPAPETPRPSQPEPADVQYLLDEAGPPSSHWRMYLALILLILCGILIFERWQRSGYPWAKQAAPAPAASVPDTNETTPPAQPKADVAPEPKPAEPPKDSTASSPPPTTPSSQDQSPKPSEVAAAAPTDR